MDILIPVDEAPKIGSRQIIESFMSSSLNTSYIDDVKINRDPNSIYTSLKMYLSKHTDIQIDVRLIDGKVMLCKKNQS
jgi:hypothetical protein